MHLSALLWITGSLSAGAAIAAANVQTLSERIELLDWSDPERAVRLIDAAATPAERPLLGVPMLEVSGMVYADVHRDPDVASTLADLQSAAGRGDRSAAVALHYVRAYTLYRDGRYAGAADELQPVDIESILAPAEQFRVLMLRGVSLRGQRQNEAAATTLRQALAIAQSLGDEVRSVRAMVALASTHVEAQELDRDAEQLTFAQTRAASLGDDAVLTAVDGALADLAGRRGDLATERGLRLSALEHARQARSDKWLADAFTQLGGFNLKTRNFRESLNYTKLAARLVARVGGSSDESTLSLNEGLALIALGNGRQGQEMAERAIADTTTRDDLPGARDMLRRYADALQRSGYLMMAIQAYQRFGALSDRLSSSAHAGAAAPARAADEVVAPHRLGASPVDSGPVASATPQRRLRQQLVMAIVLGVAGIGAALVWAFSRIKQADGRSRLNGKRDPLTGVWNRRYFNEQALPIEGERPMSGCVLLADLDHFNRINATWGQLAGDAALKTVSGRLAGALRDGDTQIRWEGDAFLFLLEGVTSEQANQTAERLLDAVRTDSVPWNGHSIDCTLSIGYACFPLAGATAPISMVGAISLVEKALYEAKRRGRDRACLVSAVGGQAHGISNVAAGDAATSEYDRTIELTEMGVAA